MSGHHSVIFPNHAISQVHKQVGLVRHNIQVVSTWQSSNRDCRFPSRTFHHNGMTDIIHFPWQWF